MRRTCERPGCSAPVAAVYGYRKRGASFEVWLDVWDAGAAVPTWPDEAHGAVCERHALSMSAPVGWDLVDRRESVPRLFVPRPFLVHSRSPDATEPTHGVRAPRRIEPAAAGRETPDDSAALRRKRVTDLPVPQLFADLHGQDRPGSDRVPAHQPHQDSVVERDTSRREATSMEDDDSLSSLLDATGPLLRRAFGKRNTGRHDASKELMRPTTHRVVDESA